MTLMENGQLHGMITLDASSSSFGGYTITRSRRTKTAN